jgi:flagellar protein FliL
MSDKAPAPEKPADPAAAAAAPAKAPSPFVPIIAVCVLMPGISFATTQYLLLPKIRGAVLEQKAIAHAAKPEGGKGDAKKGHGEAAKGGHGKDAHGKGEQADGGGGAFSYDFTDIVVNLSGAMGTRYLKTSFTTLSDNPDLKTLIDENKKQLLDVALTVLGSRTMADLEQPGSKNVVRNDLMANFNQALKSDLVTQIYFSEFVVQ